MTNKQLIARAVAELRDIQEGGDIEASHLYADKVLIDLLSVLAPEVAVEWDKARDRVGFWYA